MQRLLSPSCLLMETNISTKYQFLLSVNLERKKDGILTPYLALLLDVQTSFYFQIDSMLNLNIKVVVTDSSASQDQPFAVKNPKLDSNSALAKKRRAKTAGGTAAPPTIQEQITQESMEVRPASEYSEQHNIEINTNNT